MKTKPKEKLKLAVSNYKVKINKLKKKVVTAIRNYKEAVDQERVENARKRMKITNKKSS